MCTSKVETCGVWTPFAKSMLKTRTTIKKNGLVQAAAYKNLIEIALCQTSKLQCENDTQPHVNHLR